MPGFPSLGEKHCLLWVKAFIQSKQYFSLREGNPGNVLLTSRICLQYFYQCYPQSLKNRALFNFQNFGNEQPKKIQLCMLSIPQKISCWGIMKQTKLNLVTIWRIARKTYGKLEELTLMVILIWPILRVRSFWRQHLHLQTPWKLTKVR